MRRHGRIIWVRSVGDSVWHESLAGDNNRLRVETSDLDRNLFYDAIVRRLPCMHVESHGHMYIISEGLLTDFATNPSRFTFVEHYKGTLSVCDIEPEEYLWY